MREIKADESREWDDFVAAADNGHLFQSWGWGEFKRRYGWLPVRLAYVRDGQIAGAAQVLLRSVAGFSLAYVPRGPVVPGDQPDMYRNLLRAIHQVSRRRHSIFLKIQPNEPCNAEMDRFLRELGFLRSPHMVDARATMFVDLRGGSDAVFARLPKQTRYNIRLAERRGVTVRHAQNDSDLERFHELMSETGERAQFRVRSLGYYRDMLDHFRQLGQAELLLAEIDGQVIAGMMRFAFGPEGMCLFGGSTRDYSREKPNYLLQWKAMQWCMERGCTRYDLWGIPEEAVEEEAGVGAVLKATEKRSGLWGVYEFKRHFGNWTVRYIGAYDYPYLRPLYLFWTNFRSFVRQLI